jgi:hypothetical protein
MAIEADFIYQNILEKSVKFQEISRQIILNKPQ